MFTQPCFCQSHLGDYGEMSYGLLLSNSPLFWQLNENHKYDTYGSLNHLDTKPFLELFILLAISMPRASHHSLPLFFLPSPPSQSFLPFPSQLPVLSCSRRARTLPRSVAQHHTSLEQSHQMSSVFSLTQSLIRVTILCFNSYEISSTT